MPNITKSGHEPIVSGIHIFASHRLSDKPRTATNSALLFGLSQSCKSIQIKTCGFLSIKLWPFHRDKYRETSSLKFMTDIVRHLKIGILHPSNSFPVIFYALFSGDKYREIDDKYRETRHMDSLFLWIGLDGWWSPTPWIRCDSPYVWAAWLLLCARAVIQSKSRGI